ncbi:hypothetical protein DSECCO2_642880 [anaerobic digester metagenome]
MAYGRQGQVRIFGCVAVTGKVFGYRHHAVFFHSPGKGNALPGYVGGKFAERPCTYDRVVGIAVHIDGRSKVNVDAHFTTLPGYLFPIALYRFFIVNGTGNQVARKRRRIPQAHGQSPLTV